VGALGLAGLAAATATGAVTGVAAGGLIGALTKAGVSHEVATSYDTIVQAGGVVIGLTGLKEMTDEARGILEDNAAQEISFVDTQEDDIVDESVESTPDMSSAHPERGFQAGRSQPAFGERRDMREEPRDV
jgi:hypothetical protein